MSQFFIFGHAAMTVGYFAVAIFADGPIMRWFGLGMGAFGVINAFAGLMP